MSVAWFRGSGSHDELGLFLAVFTGFPNLEVS
jgi:hypothetical protein